MVDDAQEQASLAASFVNASTIVLANSTFNNQIFINGMTIDNGTQLVSVYPGGGGAGLISNNYGGTNTFTQLNYSGLNMGNSTVNVSMNTSSISVGSNVNLTTANIQIGNSIVNSYANSINFTIVNSTANTVITSSGINISNSSVNTQITSNGPTTDNGTTQVLINPFGIYVNNYGGTAGNFTHLTATALTLANSSASIAINLPSLQSNAAANGYQNFPGGVAMAWGWVSANSTATAVSFPAGVFATNVYNVQVTCNNVNFGPVSAYSFTKTGCNIKTSNATVTNCFWFATGT